MTDNKKRKEISEREQWENCTNGISGCFCLKADSIEAKIEKFDLPESDKQVLRDFQKERRARNA